ncbi:MAG: bifunctional 4-hydroxy-3-methylbut-2-enyl diphosphate reductase/30S ribosomal protein S1 [Eubacteriales bacterium]
MEIVIGKNAGFCFGVKRAVDTVNSLSAEKKPDEHIYTLGRLIHNPRVIRQFEEQGVRVIEEDDIDRIFEESHVGNPSVIVIRAHGSTASISKKLAGYAAENPYFRVVDCTCPYVKKIHSIVERQTADGSALLVLGDQSHPEVRGIVSYAKGEVRVTGSADQLDLNNLDKKSVVMVAQTTQKLSEWKKAQEIAQNHLTNLQIYDTICRATQNRQSETEQLSKKVDLMFVIGGRESSNTAKLYSVSKRNLEQTFLIEDGSDIPEEALRLAAKAEKIGITAGASTPGDIIQEVKTIMSEIIENENFEALLEDSLKTLNTGDIVNGTITSISATEVHVDLSANVTGILDYNEIANADPAYKVGDSIEAYVVRVSDIEGVAGLSRKRIERIDDWKKIVAAKENGTVLEGKITKINKGGCMIALGAIEAFIPASQTGIPKGEELTPLKGTTQKVIIIEIEEGRNRATASIKAVQRAERKEAAAKIWAELEVGKKYVGTVKSLTSYGAFVDLGGVDGMVHITELSWSRIKNPAEVVSVGDQIEVYVKSFDAEKKRISLGCKTEETNPWNIFTSTYKEGDVATVKIVGLTPFGAFAEIVPEVDGLIHISQIADRKIATPAEVLHLDDVVQVKILGIDTEKKKVSLSMRALLEDEDAEGEAEDAE